MSRQRTDPQPSRRSVLRGGLLLTAGVLGTGTAAACSATTGGSSGASAAPTRYPPPRTSESTVPPSTAPRTLLAYFSRPGENYYRGGRRDLEVGNTEVLARQIAGLISCDIYRIEAADPYSDSYDDTVARNVREADEDARPGIADPLPLPEQYDDILIGSPVWNVRTPMIMMTFAEGLELTGTTVHPFVTYAVSGLGRAQADYDDACRGAEVRPGLAVPGEEASEHEDDVRAWLVDGGLLA